jgi:predicted Abi (CAAX) family protease
MNRILKRISIATQTIPQRQDWILAFALLLLYTVIYIPIGLKLGFLKFKVFPSWLMNLGVMASSFVMPGLLEELGFRVILIPHRTEPCTGFERLKWVGLSWILFMLYHVHPFTPPFFKTFPFLLGAGLIGIICSIAYLRSGSLWIPVFIHWLIVAIWLLLLGGLDRFQK